jgi:solute carrier family 25 (mitochondrial S-adenosylmethionine transporter), member 26
MEDVPHSNATSFSIQGACLVRVPTEIVKTRSQTSAYGPLTSSLHSARMVLRADGLKGFYRGFGITVFREVIPATFLNYSHQTIFSYFNYTFACRLFSSASIPKLHFMRLTLIILFSIQ